MIPKAELHVHLEGTAPPALIRRIALRNGIPVPEGVFKTEDEFEWTDFLHFLRTYDLAASVIRTPQDYRDVTYEYLSSCAAEGAIYVELIASPDHAAAAGLSDADHYAAIAQGIDDARADHGIEARIIIAAIRNFGVEAAEKIARNGTPTTAIPTSSASTWSATRRPGRRPSSRAPTRSPPAPGSAAPSTPASTRAPSRCARRSSCPITRHLARRAGDRGSRARRRARRAGHGAGGVSELERGARRSIPSYEDHPLVRSGTPGCGSHSALTTLPISDVVSAQSMPWRASASALRRSS